jgi:seryl-tRNA synthetase
MLTEYVVLNTAVPNKYADEIERRLFFVSDDIVDFRLITHADRIAAIEVTTARDVGPGTLAKKIATLIDTDILRQRPVPAKVIWRSTRQRPYQADMFERLLEQGIAYEAGEGQVALGEPFLSLMDWFDLAIKRMVLNTFNAKEYRYPTLIPTAVLERCGYFDSFPHFLMFVTRLHNDIDNYRSFVKAYQDRASIDAFVFEYCKNTDYCLPPTMCYHTYHQYCDKVIDPATGAVITSRGKSFRFESKYQHGLERLWDFTIREIVFLGTRDFVLDCRRRFMQGALDFIEQLGLTGYCEVANDPFFCKQDMAEKIWSQRLLELKYELRLHVDAPRSIAVGSFNFHEGFFGEGFNIKHGVDGWVRTACVGFGLERLVYAFLCQYGLDSRTWPGIIREGMNHDEFLHN